MIENLHRLVMPILTGLLVMNRYFYSSSAAGFVLLTTIQLYSLPVIIIENDCPASLSSLTTGMICKRKSFKQKQTV